MGDRSWCVGLDLSLTDAGLAILPYRPTGRDQPVFLQSIKTGTKDGSHIERMDWIATLIIDTLRSFHGRDHKIQLITIEGYAYSKSGQTLAELGGIVKHELWRFFGVSECWMTVVPGEVKRFATGNWNASKQDMIAAASRDFKSYGDADLAKNHNVADAIHIARTGRTKFT
jgi:Holliday junction resolvasome RuvABC endonuclease subunit